MILHTLRGFSATVALAAVLSAGAPAVISTIAQASATTLHASAAVNVRLGPSTSKARIGVLYPGDEVSATGSSVGGWTPVTYKGSSAWVSTRYLSGGSYEPTARYTAATGSAWATANLNLRSAAGPDKHIVATLPAGTRVTRTGTVSGDWSQVSSPKGSGWVHQAYLSVSRAAAKTSDDTSSTTSGTSAEPAAYTPPSTVGTRYATTTLNLWTASSGSRYVGTVDRGTALGYTGKATNGRTQVVVKGAARWVTSSYLSSSRASTSASRTSGEGQATATGSCNASYYSDPQLTANGEQFNPNSRTAASKTLKFNTRVSVTNVANGRSTVVRINDRGPYVSGRCLDLSRAAFDDIASPSAGVIAVRYTVLG